MSKNAAKSTNAKSPSEADAGLPQGWAAAKLGEICQVNPGKPSRHELPDDAAVSFVAMPAVDAHLGIIATHQVRSAGVLRKGFTAFRNGDVIVAKITPSMENGKAAVAHSLASGFGFGSTEFHVLRPRAGVVPEYVLHFVRQQSFRALAEMNMTGTAGQRRVPAAFLKEATIPLPPSGEQRRIADRLHLLMSRIQSVRARLHRVSSLLDTLRQAVLAAAVDGRLLDTKSMSSTGSRGWSLLRAQDVCTRVQNGGTPKKGFVDSPGVPFLKVYNIVNQKINFDYKPQFVTDDIHAGPLAKSQTLPGDVLMNIVGPPLGKVAVVPPTYPSWNINQAIALFRPGERITTEWLYILLCSGRNVAEVEPETRGIAGQSNISITQCREFLFPVPPLDEQRAISRRVGDLFAMFDLSLVRCHSAARIAESLPSSVSRKAFAGELCETEASIATVIGSAYESGEQLLDWIRSQPLPPNLRKKNSEEKPMVKSRETPRDILRRAVEVMPHRRFSFDDLRAHVFIDYDAIRDVLFDLLDTPSSGVRQVFDVKTKTMMLERTSK